MVDLVRAGRDPAELAREFEPTAQSISTGWRKRPARGPPEEKGNGLLRLSVRNSPGLRRENKQLRLEHDILLSSGAWFARETGADPPGSSNS